MSHVTRHTSHCTLKVWLRHCMQWPACSFFPIRTTRGLGFYLSSPVFESTPLPLQPACVASVSLAICKYVSAFISFLRTRSKSHVTCHTSHVTRHTSHVTRHTSHVTRHTSHVTRHTSHVTRHTSHVTRHTSHVTRHTLPLSECPSPLPRM